MQRAPFRSSTTQTVSQCAAASAVATVRLQGGLLSAVAACLVLWGGQGVCRAELPDRPAGFRVETHAITGARVTTSPGHVLDQATVVCRGGRIIAVGQGVPVPPDALLIDGAGLHVYAGFIEAASSKPVDPAQNPPQTPGRRKTDTSRYILAATPLDNRQHLTPAWSVLSGIKADHASIASARKAGFTAVHVVPADRIASGTGTLITTARDALREIVLREATWAGFRLKAQGGANYPATLMGATAHLRQALLDAKHHALQRKLYAAQLENRAGAAIPQPPRDADLVALNRVLDRQQPALFAVSSRDDVERAIQFSEEHQLQLLLWGAEQTDQLAHRLRGIGVPVVLRFDPDSRPEADSDAAGGKNSSQLPEAVLADRQARWDQRAGTLAALHAAGVEVAVSSEGLDDHDELIERLRTAIEKGLPANAALAALTTTPARLLGVEQILGTVEPGRLSHLVVLTGPLEDTRSKVRYVLTGTELLEQNQGAQPVGRSPVEAPRPVTDLSGEWRIRIDRTDGDLLAVLRLTMLGTSLGGTFESEQGNGRITAGQATADGLKLTVEIGAGDRSLQLKFNGTIQGDTVSGQLVPAFGGPVKWSGSRSSQPTPGTSPAPEENAVELSLEPEPIQPAEAPLKTEAKKKPEQSPETSTAAARQTTGTKKNAEPPTEPAKAKAEEESTSAATALLLATGEQRPVELEQHRLACRRMTGGNLLIQNGTVLTGTGQTLKNTSIRIAGGKITEIGTDLRPGSEETVIDAAGRFIMPGVIDTHSHIMIEGGVNEATLSVVPEVRVADALRTDDVREFRALAAGVTTARLLHGSANVIGGQHAVVKLKYGASPAEHLVDDAPNGVKFALGENVKYRRDRFPNTRLGVEATLQRAFLEALDYRRRRMRFDRLAQARMKEGAADEPTAELPLPVRRDLRLDALVEIIEQQSFIHAHCYRADEILMLLRTAAGLGIRVRSLQHVLEGYKIAPEIVAHGASCSTFSDWWAYKVEAYDATPFNAALLHEAGANVVIKSDDAEAMRHLPMEAAKSVRYGRMPAEIALQMVTRNAARELGLADRIGTVEIGMDGDLAIFNGHPLSPLSRCEMTVIEGDVWFDRSQLPTTMSQPLQERTVRAPAVAGLEQKQHVEIRDLPGSDTWAVRGATVHPADGPVLHDATVVVQEGRIVSVGTDITPPEGIFLLEGRGLHVFPGFIDAGTTLGLVEIGKVRETRDHAETGDLQPDLRAGVGINRDSELIPVARAGGIITALVQPDGGTIPGQASLVRLSGWTAPEMVLNLEAALRIRWPSGEETSEEIEKLSDFLQLGRQYGKALAGAADDDSLAPLRDPRLEALLPYLNREKPIYIEAETRQQIEQALKFADKQQLQLVLTGATDAWKLAEELARRKTPVILGPVMRSPTEDYDPFDAPYANPGLLHEAGVPFCIRSDSASNSRNAPFEAAVAVAWGLPRAAGLRSVTLSAAEILGIAEETGSLTPGKRADLIIADGPPLQPATEILAISIAGVCQAPASRQTRFYELYRQRLHEQQQSPAASGSETAGPADEAAEKAADQPAASRKNQSDR